MCEYLRTVAAHVTIPRAHTHNHATNALLFHLPVCQRLKHFTEGADGNPRACDGAVRHVAAEHRNNIVTACQARKLNDVASVHPDALRTKAANVHVLVHKFEQLLPCLLRHAGADCGGGHNGHAGLG